MVADEEDTKMTDAGDDEAAAGKKEQEDSSKDSPTIPPLEAAAQRLERLLGGGDVAAAATAGKSNSRAGAAMSSYHYSYINPGKVVRRWLGTASGAASEATAEGIQAAAAKLLDPVGRTARGRGLLVAASNSAAAATAMRVGEGAAGGDGETPAPYLVAAAREVEAWLISLAARLLWKEHRFAEAFDLAQRGIAVLMAHLDEASLKVASMSSAPSSSLFPLLARMYRLRSLVAESIPESAAADLHAGLRTDMARAHNMASLRRDVDTQSTLLNCMLRDLLRHSQGTCFLVHTWLSWGFHTNFACLSDLPSLVCSRHGTNLCYYFSRTHRQSSKPRSCFRTRPSPRPLRTTSSAGTCTTPAGSKP
jgi:hypothetical protein